MPDPSEAPTLPPCPWRYRETWCLRRMSETARGADGSPLPVGEAEQAMPLSTAEIVRRCTKMGLSVEDALCRRLSGPDCADAPGLPRYDDERGTLSFDGQVIRQFHRKAEHQRPILQAFQDTGWPRRLENVLARLMPWDSPRRLSDAVTELNEQQTTKRIHFWVERGTHAVHWEPIDEATGRQHGPANRCGGC